MITLLSPAKKLLNIEQPYSDFTSLPIFTEKTAELLALMQAKSPEQIAELMHLSEDLARLNYQRYQNFSSTEKYPAIFLFQGDVYKGLAAETWDQESLDFAQSHLMILSGLYGLLKPLDLINPYRLEMGTRLMNPSGKNLYACWTMPITRELNRCLGEGVNPVLVNLASAEYFKALDCQNLKFPIIHLHFMEQRENKTAVVGIHAKKARGAMASFMMQHRLNDVESLKQFKGLNYHFAKKHSDKDNLVFIRKQPVS